MGSRIFAAIAAIVMVLGAVAVRDRVDNGDDASTGSNSDRGALRLVCATELRVVCDGIEENDSGLEVTVEAATATAARLRSAAPDTANIDGWLAPGPWGEFVNASRAASAGPLFAEAGEALGRSPFVVAIWKAKRGTLACPDPVDLGCLGDAVNTRGFRLGVAGDAEAEGVLADAALSVGHSKNPNFATNDLRETDLAEWIAAVDASADRVLRNPGGRSFTELLTFGTAAADGYLSTEAVVGPQFARAAKRGQLDLAFVSPTVTADVSFAPRPGDRGERLAAIVRSDRVRALLRDIGWRVNGLRPIAGIGSTTPRLSQDDGLPSAGVLFALTEITR